MNKEQLIEVYYAKENGHIKDAYTHPDLFRLVEFAKETGGVIWVLHFDKGNHFYSKECMYDHNTAIFPDDLTEVKTDSGVKILAVILND